VVPAPDLEPRAVLGADTSGKAVAGRGPQSHAVRRIHLDACAGLDERYVREWLANQAASGYVTYDPATATFVMTPEQAAVFADPDSPAAMTGGF